MENSPRSKRGMQCACLWHRCVSGALQAAEVDWGGGEPCGQEPRALHGPGSVPDTIYRGHCPWSCCQWTPAASLPRVLGPSARTSDLMVW